uniref:PMS1 protein homolog 1 n=1 Tax=Geotrypetes seraphini TaxID=260995 RepID=A0A6P8RFL5_GEOSA|nr:PMS1 protein homolog 1 [Geotrypetes seraphini]XP_033802499.1 PMS1 protein homolog 1 [Geotrypetes seraphini]
MKQLSAATIRLLSSSQVITSVVSLVKELVENSLDARATSIDVKLENYGFDKIEVRDNGDGIKAADVPVMAVKHYTSKINSHEDLQSLQTYGFRGEALGSICCIAEVSVTTKTADDDFSTQYVLDSYGHVTSQKPSHLGQGTTVTVHKLFKNLPVRKQFYSTTKKCKEEIKRVQDLLMAYGIIKPNLRIIFTHNKAVIWQKTRVSDHKMALLSVLGTAVMSSMVPFQHQCEDSEVLLSGFLPKPDSNHTLTSLSSPGRSFIFINQRLVYQKDILKLIRLYCNLTFSKDPIQSYPIFFISIIIPSSAVDVNVTPDKTQVMMQNKESVLRAVENVLMSLYGNLPGILPVENNNTDVSSPDMYVNKTGLTDVLVNEAIPSGNDELKTHTSFFSVSNDMQNVEHGKNKEICLRNQVHCNDNPPGLFDKNEVSGIEKMRSDIFQAGSINNFSSGGDSQSDYKVTFTMDDASLMDMQPHRDQGSPLGAKQINEAERLKERTIPKDISEICADNWSRGNVFKNSEGKNLEPVKILMPSIDRDMCHNESDKSQPLNSTQNYCSKNPKTSNVINEKFGQITAYNLISNHVIRKPKSANTLFMQEYRSRILADNPKASLENIAAEAENLWIKLSEEEKRKYEEKAVKDVKRYSVQAQKALNKSTYQPVKEVEKGLQVTTAKGVPRKNRLKAALSNQQILDKMFQSQIEKKKEPMKIVQVPFTLSTLKGQLGRLSKKCSSDGEELCFISKLGFPGAWIIASEKKIMLLNPYRVEEALLFKRLLDNHKIPAETLEKSIVLTDSLLGGSHYMDVLYTLQKDSPKLNGSTYFSDLRLVGNGFQIKVVSGTACKENQLEIEGMANCLPFYGISDLKEILNAVISKNAKELSQCRPLKVINYLEGEAVRLSRQLPLYLSKEDVQDTICRMNQQLGNENKGCVHGRPFFYHLTDIPEVK